MSSDDSRDVRNCYKSKPALLYKIYRRPWVYTMLPHYAPKAKPSLCLSLKFLTPRPDKVFIDLRNKEKAGETMAQCPDKPALACMIR